MFIFTTTLRLPLGCNLIDHLLRVDQIDDAYVYPSYLGNTLPFDNPNDNRYLTSKYRYQLILRPMAFVDVFHK